MLRNWGLPARRAAVRVVIVLTVAALSVVLVACGGGDADEPERAAPSPTLSPTSDGVEAGAAAKALAAYDGFQEAYIAAFADPGGGSGRLAEYAGSQLLAQVRFSLQSHADQGLVIRGRPVWSPTVVEVNLMTRPFSVLIRDCFDQSGLRTVYEATGKSAAAPGQASRYLVDSKAELYDDGRWLMSTSEAHRDRPC